MSNMANFPWEELKLCAANAAGVPPLELEPLPGGASTRQFVRVHFGDGLSAVAMFFPEAMASDELAKPLEVGERWPFLQVHELLASHGVAVPKILAQDTEHGLLIVEDLGDDTLARYLERYPNSREQLYHCAVQDLARAQGRLQQLPSNCIIRRRSFDYDLLRWEIEHFKEFALEAQGIQLSPAESTVFNDAAKQIAHQAADWSHVFVHRDYQSRNLMVRTGADGRLELVWIDFQDALIGPRVYDLVALLSDSYQSFSTEFVDERLRDYLLSLEQQAPEFSQLRYEFDWITVQRKLKDAGRFVYIDRVKGNSSFLQFVVPTIAKVRVALANLRNDPVLRRLDDCVFDWFTRIAALHASS